MKAWAALMYYDSKMVKETVALANEFLTQSQCLIKHLPMCSMFSTNYLEFAVSEVK